jgi:transposase
MLKFKKGLDRAQELLLPMRLEDYLKDGHLARLVCDICDRLDLSKIEAKYNTLGQHAYDPRMMVALLFYSYATGTRSSRKISKACEDRFDFVYISRGLKPSHDRISDFRKDNLEGVKELFKEIVLIGANLGLAKLGNIKVSIDGTKIRANASPKLSKDEDGLRKLLKKTESEIEKILDEAEEIDEIESEKYGKDKRGDELPKKLQSKKSRKNAIEDALKKLKKQKEEMEKSIREEKGREPTKSERKKIEKKKINLTDPDANYMKEREGVIKPNYNCQISVDEEEQFIVANDVTTECNDQHQLIPMLINTKDNVGTPDKTKADNGYFTQLKDAVRLFPETDIYIDDKNRRKEDLNMKKIEEEYDEIPYKNLTKLLSKEGNEEYKKRMHTVEPPFGNIKFNLGYRYFLLRGTDKVKGEFGLMCIAHDIKKIMNFLTRSGKNLNEEPRINQSISNSIA